MEMEWEGREPGERMTREREDTVVQKWRRRLDGGEVVSRPAVMDSGDIIVGTIQGSVCRLNSTGGQVWKVLISLLSLPLHPLSSRELSITD